MRSRKINIPGLIPPQSLAQMRANLSSSTLSYFSGVVGCCSWRIDIGMVWLPTPNLSQVATLNPEQEITNCLTHELVRIRQISYVQKKSVHKKFVQNSCLDVLKDSTVRSEIKTQHSAVYVERESHRGYLPSLS